MVFKEKKEIAEIAVLIRQLTPMQREDLKRGLTIAKAIFGGNKKNNDKQTA